MFGLLAQEFKTLFKSPSSISILIIPLVLLVGLGYLLPSGWIVPSSITIGIVGAVLLYFGGSIEEIKRTSFMKSVSLTRLSKFSFLATKILFSIFVSMIAVLWVLLFSWVFTSVDAVAFLATDFSNLLPEGSSAATDVIRNVPFDINWENVKWVSMLYAGIITIVVAVSISFVFVAFAKSSLSFYLMSFGYLLAMILFGGVVMPSFLISADNAWFKNLYYLVPNFYTNNVMADSFSGGVINSIKVGDVYLLKLLNSIDGGATVIENVFNTVFHPVIFPDAITESDNAAIFDLFHNSAGTFGNIGTSLKPDTGWDGSIKQLDAWKEATIAAGAWSNNLDTFYNAMITPLNNAGVNSYPALIGGEVKSLILSQLDPESGVYGILSGVPKGTIGSALWDGTGAGAATITAALGIDSLPAIFAHLFYMGSNGDNQGIFVLLSNIENVLHSVVGTLNDMAAPSAWYDWTVPWLETGIFLGIAVTFFRWS